MDLEQQKLLQKVAKEYSLELLLLFGSRAKGKERQDSDYDIAYLSKRSLSLKEEGGIIIDLVPVLRVADERLIDLVDIKNADPLLLYYIFKDGVLLCGEKLKYHQMKVYAFNQYIDTKPLRELEALMIKRRQKELMEKYAK